MMSPFIDFEINVMNHLNCYLVQLMPSAWRALQQLEEDAKKLGVTYIVKLFYYWFTSKMTEKGWVAIQRQRRQLAGFPAGVSNMKNWEGKYFLWCWAGRSDRGG